MENQLLIAVIAGLGGMLGWGLADFFAKKTIDQVGDVVSLAWGHIFGTIILALLALYRLGTVPDSFFIPQGLGTWVLLAFLGTMQAVVYLLVYNGFSKGQVGVLSPIFASFSGLVALLSIVVLREVVSDYLLIGLGIIFLGVLMINLDVRALLSKRFHFTHIPGFKEVGIATLLAALWTLSWNKFIAGNDWLSYALWMYAFMTVVILVVCKVQKLKLAISKVFVWKYLVLIGACETLAYLAISLGYSTTTHTSVIALLSGAFSLPTIIGARLFLKEKYTAIQTLGSVAVIVGIMLLAF